MASRDFLFYKYETISLKSMEEKVPTYVTLGMIETLWRLKAQETIDIYKHCTPVNKVSFTQMV